ASRLLMLSSSRRCSSISLIVEAIFPFTPSSLWTPITFNGCLYANYEVVRAPAIITISVNCLEPRSKNRRRRKPWRRKSRLPKHRGGEPSRPLPVAGSRSARLEGTASCCFLSVCYLCGNRWEFLPYALLCHGVCLR